MAMAEAVPLPERESDATAEEGPDAARKRRRAQHNDHANLQRCWDVRRRVEEVATEVESVAGEAFRIRGPSHLPLPPASSLSVEKREALASARSRRLAELVSTHCKKVLGGITAHKWCWPFLAPVDVAVYTDYLAKVPRPIDFGVVRANLEAGAYSHPDAFVADVRLVFNNAKAYNPPGSDVHVMADTLLERFDEKYVAYVVPRIADAEALSRREEESARRELLGSAASPGEGSLAVEQALLRRLEVVSASLAEAKSAAAAACLPLTRAEKVALCDALGALPQQAFEAALGLLLHRCPGLEPQDGLGFDIAAMDALTLRQLESFVAAAAASQGKPPIWPNEPGAEARAPDALPLHKD